MIRISLEKILAKQLHPVRINKAFEKIIETEEHFQPLKQPNINRIATVQREIKTIKSVDDFAREMFQFVKKASEQHAHYIIFPEYNFFDLFHLIPGLTTIDRILNRYAKRNVGREIQKGNVHLQSNHTLQKLFNIVAQPTENALLTIMQRLAQHFRMYIYTGTYIHKQGDQLFNRGSLIDPQGEIIYHQDKVHLTDFEASIDLARGNNFQVIELPIGNVAIPICMDASFFETFKLVTSLRADIVIIPIANNEPYNQWRAMRGIWGRVQEAYVYGVKSSLNGWIGGMQFTGKAGFFAPCEMTEHLDGIIQISEKPTGDYVIIQELDISQLQKARKNAAYFGDRNETFEANYYKNTYEKGGT